jgi:ribosomal-protein-alanine N-acetyltransferase
MIPLIAQTPRLLILASSRALITAELHKPQYFPVLLGATMPSSWPPAAYDRAAMEFLLEKLTAGGRDAAGWYSWYALRKADDTTPRILVGSGSFMGPPDVNGLAEIDYFIAPEWRGQGLATELVAGLVQQAIATGMVRLLVAHTSVENSASQRVLMHNGFVSVGTDVNGQLRFERSIEPINN